MIGEAVPIPRRPSPPRVLILDFDAITLIRLEQLLEEAGLDTTTTWNLPEACLYLKEKSFDLLVVGDHPPQIDAVAILRRLEALHRAIPSIVMRARAEFLAEPERRPLVTALPGCNGSEVLEKVLQRLTSSTSAHSAKQCTAVPAGNDASEPLLVRMMWG